MSDFEKIVRPFAPRNPFTSRSNVIQQPPVPNGADARLVIVGKQSASWQQTDVQPLQYSSNWDEDVSQRKTSRQKIEDPDDPNTYVEVERIDEMVFKNGRDGSSFRVTPFAHGANGKG